MEVVRAKHVAVRRGVKRVRVKPTYYVGQYRGTLCIVFIQYYFLYGIVFLLCIVQPCRALVVHSRSCRSLHARVVAMRCRFAGDRHLSTCAEPCGPCGYACGVRACGTE